ncbi:MAG: hypothetical protein RI894_2277, partial [Bacteroidota bacterium]
MKHFLQFIVLIIGFLLPNMMYAQDFNLVSKTEEVFHGCATDVLHRNNAVLRQAQNVLDANVMSVQNLQNLKSLSPTAVYTIPVVIHIIHNNGAENISNAQAQTAITHLNAAFQANGNARIQFCLAQRDPQGNATTGITRNVSPLTNMTMETEDLAVKDLNRWLPTCYLNIWVVKEITSQSMGSGVVGYAYFPSAHGQNMDGLLIEAGYFGNSVQNDAVAAHEVGHYLGLYHTFEGGCPNGNCLQEGDHVCDTPPDQTTFASCAPPTNSCSTDTDDASANNPFTTDTPDYGDDYMDYSDLSCYNRFTAGQYDRMQFFLTSVRSSLLACQGCMSPCPAPITLSLLANNTNTNIGTSVTFTATATNAATYQYYINPSTSLGASQNLTYTFNTAGTFWVKCRASNGALCSAVDSVIVRVFPPGVTAFYSLTATDSVGCVTLATIFNYEILNGSTTAYLSFGDGTPNLPITGSGTVLHNYVAGVWYAAIYDNGQVQFSYPIFVHNTYIDGRYVQGYGSNPTPYYPRCSVIANGIGHLPNTGQNVWAEWNLAHDFGVSANNCSFAARLQNPSATGGAWCWDLGIGIQGSKDRAWADFMGGCQVYAHVRAGSVTIDNLAALNVDVDAWHDFKIRTAGQVIYVYYDGTMVYSMPYPDDLGTLQGIQIWFRGTGNIDNVTIADGNNATLFTDDFNDCNAEPFPCACPVLTVSHDTTICAPNAAQLTASANFTTYAWSPTAGLSNPAIRDPTATPATTTNYIVTATHLGQNLIANGDFTAGNVGFTSDYIYSSFSPGNYTVAYEWFNTPGHAQVEHTGNNGNYMSVDGSTTPNTTVWQQTVPTVLPNTDYQFTYWALTDLSAAILEVKINNVTLPITTLISDCDQTQCYWKPYTFTWNSGSNTSA